MPRAAITPLSLAVLIGAWEFFGRDINPVFGSYPSAIAAAFVELVRTGQLGAALYESLRPFVVGYGLAIIVGVPLGLVIGRFRIVEAALGIYVTAGYAMPLVALVPLLILWLGLGFAVKAAVVFLMSLFPITINTWLGVAAVPKSLIEVGRAFVASDAVILAFNVRPVGDARAAAEREGVEIRHYSVIYRAIEELLRLRKIHFRLRTPRYDGLSLGHRHP